MTFNFSSSSHRWKYWCRAFLKAVTASFWKKKNIYIFFFVWRKTWYVRYFRKCQKKLEWLTILLCSLDHCSLNSLRHLSISFFLAAKAWGGRRASKSTHLTKLPFYIYLLLCEWFLILGSNGSAAARWSFSRSNCSWCPAPVPWCRCGSKASFPIKDRNVEQRSQYNTTDSEIFSSFGTLN